MLTIEVRCDDCQTLGMVAVKRKAHQMRRELKADGWQCGERGGSDYCPVCREKRRADVGCTVRVGGGPNSRSVRYHKCRRPVAVVDVDDNGWCAQHATADRTVICDHCHMTAAQGCACEDAAEYGIAI